MITLPDGTTVLVDANGTVRVRMGAQNIGGTDLAQFYHITRDGEYEDGVMMRSKDFCTEELAKFRATYDQCHTWHFSGTGWYSIAAAGVGFGRWTPELLNSVPMCVRMAEVVR